MPIKENPFGVGYSGGTFVSKDGRCACCGLPFVTRVRSTETELPANCESCASHHHEDGEASDRTIERLLRAATRQQPHTPRPVLHH